MRETMRRIPLPRPRRETLREDSVSGLVLGVQSVPDGLATGLLAGVNPVSGLYAYIVGTIVGAVATSSAFMVVQATGAMAVKSPVRYLSSMEEIITSMEDIFQA